MSGRHTGVTLVLGDMALGEVALHIVFDNITSHLQTWKDHHCYVDIITVTHFFLVYLNINLIIYRKFRMPRLDFQIAKFDHCQPTFGSLQLHPEFSSNCSFLFTNRYTTKVHSILKIFCPWNQLLIMLTYSQPALHLGIGPLLMLCLFYGTRCH